jgi:hypothetical protein
VKHLIATKGPLPEDDRLHVLDHEVTNDPDFINYFCTLSPGKWTAKLQGWIEDELPQVREEVDRLIQNQKEHSGLSSEIINIIEESSRPENFFAQYLVEQSRVEKDILGYTTLALCNKTQLLTDLPYFGPDFVNLIWNLDTATPVRLFLPKDDAYVMENPAMFKPVEVEPVAEVLKQPVEMQADSLANVESGTQTDSVSPKAASASPDDADIEFDIGPDFPPRAAKFLREKLNEFKGRVFTSKLGKTHLLEHTVELVDGAQPFHSYPYRLAPQKAAALEHIVQSYLRQGLIEPCRSQYVSQAFIVGKKGAKSLDDWRLVVDYKKLNKISKKLIFPHPDREAAIQSMHGMRFVTVIDISKAFHQIALTYDSIAKTAFCTPSGVWGNKRMPMGITNGPAVQQMLMNKVFSDLAGFGVEVYIDDILIYTKS